MTVRPILEIPDPVLREVSAPVAEVDDGVRALIADMFDTMYDAPGIGLAAVQIGVLSRVVVIDLQEPEEKGGEGVRRPRAFVNPEIVEASDTLQTYNEGCLSIPEQYGEVTRPERIRARWLDETGMAREEQLDGLMAICLQHEIDHLNGVLFIDHLSKLKRDMLVKKLTKYRRERGG
ncbi:MAG TPA: peptide deformylase [Sphingomonadaceae bacterium]|nr:peptide deformylase [Sphingomonadaceae bacterium]